MAYMYFYSERPGTLAAKRYADDVPEEVKKRRLTEVIAVQKKNSLELNKKQIGKVVEVLVEKNSKKSDNDLSGRDDQNNMVVFPRGNLKPGDYVSCEIVDCSSNVLIGLVVD
jgi:tRNA-2-methylthio-N6-dimethylallyladenosine synthase